LAREL